MKEQEERQESRLIDEFENLTKEDFEIAKAESLREFNIKGSNPESFADNARVISEMADRLASGTNWRGSGDNYKKVVETLKKLSEQSKKMSEYAAFIPFEEMRKYKELANEVDKHMNTYLKDKKIGFFSSGYAKERVETMKKMQEALKANISSYDEIFTNADLDNSESLSAKQDYEYKKSVQTEEALKLVEKRNELNKKYSVAGMDNKAKYFGKNSEFYDGKFNYGVIQGDRTAIVSLTTLALCLEKDEKGNPKYTIDEIADPDKINDAKAEMYKKIAYLTAKAGAKDAESINARKEIAKMMIDGSIAASALMDKAYSKVDFSNPNFDLTDEFARIEFVSCACFDIAQEVAHVSKEAVEYVNSMGVKAKNIVDAQNYLQKYTGLAADMSVSVTALNMSDPKYHRAVAEDNKQDITSSFCDILNSTVKYQLFKNVIAEYGKETNGKSSFTDWYVNSNWARKYDNISGMIKSAVNTTYFDLYGSLNNAKYCKELYNDVATGEYFKNVSYGRVDGINEDFTGLCNATEAINYTKLSDYNFVMDMINKRVSEFNEKMLNSEGAESKIYANAKESAIELGKFFLSYKEVDANNRKELKDHLNNIFKADLVEQCKMENVEDNKLEEVIDGTIKHSYYMDRFKNLDRHQVFAHGFDGVNKQIIEFGAPIVANYLKQASIDAEYEKLAESLKNENATNKQFIAKSKEALERMKECKDKDKVYATKEEYINDAALAVTGIIYEKTGKLPKSASTGEHYSLEEFSEKLAKSDTFVESLKSQNGKFLRADRVAKKLEDPELVTAFIVSAVDFKAPSNEPVTRKRANAVTNKGQQKAQEQNRNTMGM
ncbi:MAG: hypothetical protein K5656_00390 [Lachnospiraceae bacterium]|nr:hypothetical protein [Lachnospiraceae bacterium]